MTYTACAPVADPRPLVNAIWVPSGDQAGPKSSAGSLVSRVGLVPSALMT
ncbi:MAG TPA: hypothetical protein VF462_10965 [Micromonosporaceae bacterium]